MESHLNSFRSPDYARHEPFLDHEQRNDGKRLRVNAVIFWPSTTGVMVHGFGLSYRGL